MTMLRTNLATRPFYNEKAVHAGLLAVALVSAVVFVAGAVRFRTLASEHGMLTARAERDERQASVLGEQSVTLQRGAGSADLEVLTVAAREANQLIDQRVFSWTAFLNVIEATLPGDVRLTALRPNVDRGQVTVSIGVIGRSVESIFGFVERLEATGAFVDVLPREEEMTDEGTYRTILIGRYVGRSAQDPDDRQLRGTTESSGREPIE